MHPLITAGPSSRPAGPAMTEPGDGLSLEEITAALRVDSADVALYARVLTESLGDALPDGCVVVDRDRSMSDRLPAVPARSRRSPCGSARRC